MFFISLNPFFFQLYLFVYTYLCLSLDNKVAAAAAAKLLQSRPTLLRPHRWQPTRLPHPWDSPGKNTGVGCHFLLHCMKVKSESEVVQSCSTLSNPMDCSLPGSSIHGTLQARELEWGAIAFSSFMPRLPYFIRKTSSHFVPYHLSDIKF